MNTEQKANGNEQNANTEKPNTAPDMLFATEVEQDKGLRAFTDELDALLEKHPKINVLYVASADNNENEKTSTCIQQRGYTEPLAQGIDKLFQQNPELKNKLAMIAIMRKLGI